MATNLEAIRSESEHQAAMAEVARLWGSASGTPDGDRLDLLAALIDVYEAQQYPMDPPDPIGAILFRLEHQGPTSSAFPPTS